MELKIQKGVWHLGSVALLSIHLNGHNSVIFTPRSFKFFVVVDIEVIDKLEEKSNRGLTPRGCGVEPVCIH